MSTPNSNTTPTSPTPESSSSDPTGGQGELHRESGNASPAEAADPVAEQFVLDAFSSTPEFQEDGTEVVPVVVAAPTPSQPVAQPSSAETSPPAQPVEGQQPAQQAQQPAVQQAVPPPGQQPAQQVQPAPTQPAQQQPAVPAPAAVDPQDGFKALADAVEASRGKFEDALSTTVYQLKAEDTEALMADPASVVPKLLARAHINIVQNVLRTVGQQMPHMVGGLLEARKENSAREDAFYAKWPQLNRQTDEGTIRRLAAAYRTANPQASSDELIQMVGAQAVVALGRLQAAAPAAVPPQPRQQGFRPAAASVPAGQVNPSAINPFSAMADALLGEDNDTFMVE